MNNDDSMSHRLISSDRIQKQLREKLDNIFKEMYRNFAITKLKVEEILDGLTEQEMEEFMGEAGKDSGDVVCLYMDLGAGMSIKKASERMHNRLMVLDQRNTK